MKLKKLCFLFITSLTVLGCSFVLAVPSGDSGEISDGTSGESTPIVSGEVSGDISGESTPIESGDSSTDSGDYIDVLKSIALDLDFQTEKNTAINGVLKSSVSGDETFVYAIVTTPSHGTVTLSNATSGDFVYTPETDYVGSDLFTFRLESGDVYSNIGSVSITVKAPSEPIIPFYYEDMQEHWANYSASHLAARGYVIGENIGDEYFYFPDREMTRGDFLLFILSLVENNHSAKAADIKFADDDLYPEWLLEKAKIAYELGIIKGSGTEGSVYLNAYHKITRAEAFVMINNVLTSTKLIINAADDITFADKASIPSWSLQAIKNLSAYKIVQGDSNKNINPLDTINRGEAAEIIYKVIKQMEILKLEDVPAELTLR
ncbi:MAG: S-layer homology domain-containing protein [Clostridia bacterium]|nr:S-layer homology domain-containing protein [Clostridia bacterium]